MLCSECPVGEFLKENTCVVSCGDNYYPIGDICEKCHNNCKTC